MRIVTVPTLATLALLLPLLAQAQNLPSPKVATPTDPAQATPKGYVDGGLAAKQGINGDVSSQHVTPTGSATAMALRDAANKPCLNIDMFGADPTGATASDTAFATVAAIAAPRQGCVQFGAGIYKFDAQLSWPFPTTGTHRAIIRGIGSAGTSLFWTGTTGGILFAEHSDHHSFAVERMTLLTAQAGTADAITATNDFSNAGSSACPGTPYHSEIRDVSMMGTGRFQMSGPTQFWRMGVHATNVSFIDVDGMNITDADPAVFTNPNETGIGMLLEGTAPGAAYPSGCLAAVFNVTRSGFWNLGYGIKIGTWSQGYQLDKLNFTLGQFGIYQELDSVNTDELTISNSQLNTARYQIFLRAGVMRLGVHDNIIFLPSTQQGVFSGGNHSVSITGNHFVGILFGAGEQFSNDATGVHLVANDALNAGIITGNTFVNLTYGVALEPGTSGVTVQANAYRNVTTNVSNAGIGNIVGGGSQ